MLVSNPERLCKTKPPNDSDWPVKSVEYWTRHLVLLCAAYALGASHPNWAKSVLRLLEFVGTAWVTCLVILGLGKIRQIQSRDYLPQYDTKSFLDSGPPSEETTPLLQRSIYEMEDTDQKSVVSEGQTTTIAIEQPSSSLCDRNRVEHPQLESFYMIDVDTRKRIWSNASKPFHISNEWMEMDMIVMIRTPDTDDPTARKGTPSNDKVCEYMKGKQRRFEFQYQFKLKKAPVGKKCYFACELDEPVKMGIVTKAFVSAAMAFVKSKNPTFHYNITGSKKKTLDGAYETPHMSFTIEECVDRFVVTKPGETPPSLGSDLYEDPQDMKLRKSRTRTNWNTTDTYTMALWSSYVDYLDWKCLNLPGIKPFGLSSVLGNQPIHLTMYFIDENHLEGGGHHYRKDLMEIVKLELSNNAHSTIGKEAKQWIEAQTVEIGPSPSRESLFSEDSCNVSLVEKQEMIDDDATYAAELGEGIYLRSGDSVLLAELDHEKKKNNNNTINHSPYTVINGGGFAVLSKHKTPIVIEKAKAKKNKLIKSGDVVMFKMFQTKPGTEVIETRYLTLHRGWWLKWVTSMPSKNGYFTIYTHDDDDDTNEEKNQSSFLTLGGSFTLKHKRWSKYSVGICSEPSADFGGRMLSLYNANKKSARNHSNEDERDQPTNNNNNNIMEPSDDELDTDKETLRSRSIQPLVLCTQDPHSQMCPKSPLSENRPQPQTPNGAPLVFSNEHSKVDVPAWIEMMDRLRRVRQLAYVVRVVSPSSEDSPQEEGFLRLKSGKELAHILKMGQSIEIPQRIITPVQSAVDITTGMTKNSSQESLVRLSSTNSIEEECSIKKVLSRETLSGYDSFFEDPCTDEDDNEPCMEFLMSEGSSSDTEDWPTEKKKQRGLGKVKRLAKKTVAGTGRITKKTAKETTKLAAKGIKETSKAGKRLIAPVSRKPNKPPRSDTRKRNKEFLVSKAMKKLGKLEAKSGAPPIFVAGELSATEQSRRTASRVLERMSNVPMQSPVWQKCNDALLSEIGFATEQDSWFLDGDATHLGVKPEKKNGKLLGESVVARCLYESHWREEWCGLYDDCLCFYAPLAKSRCHEIFYSDITKIRPLVDRGLFPLAGFPVLVVETAWQCHYMAFRNEESKDAFAQILEGQVQSHVIESLEESELQKARFWQGFQRLSESSLSARAGKWAKVSSQQKYKERAILNGRRMAFDSLNSMPFGKDISKAYRFVEELLTMALTFSYQSLEKDPESFIEFLDLTSELRFLPLEFVDLSSPSAFCLFVNIYHCLLQQALLLSVNGPLHKKSVGNFMRTSCYEIGGDVFSLAELRSCVICGKLSKPIHPKPPYIEAPKQSNAHKHYALEYTDVRVHFVVNTADMACPADIPVLSHRTLEDQLKTACVDFFKQNNPWAMDPKKRTIILPKVCEVHRNDFAPGDFLRILKESSLDATTAIDPWILKGEKTVTIKFQHTNDQYHSSLKLKTGAATDQSLEVDYYPYDTHPLDSNSL